MADLSLQYLVDEPGALVPSGIIFGWEDYANTLSTLETITNRLFVETQAADACAESALSSADGSLDSFTQQIRDMQSDVSALQNHANLLSAQVLPVTGGQYTHLIVETFRSSSVQDSVSAYAAEPLTLQSKPLTGCPSRASLEIDPITQTLKQSREGSSTLFNGLPGSDFTSRGISSVDKVFGTPVTHSEKSELGLWKLSVASRSPLAPGFSGVGFAGVPNISDVPKPSWLPNTYNSGSAARIHIELNNPSPFTEIRLRGVLLPGDAETTLLETVIAVDSRPNITDPASKPTRPITLNGSFTGGYYPWQAVTPNQPGPTLVPAPGRNAASSDNSVQIPGLLAQNFSGLKAGGHAILRYRTSLPNPAVSPVSPSTSFVQVYYYQSATPQFGTDSPLDVETFRDAVPSQAGAYAGWAQSVHLLSIPDLTSTAMLVIGSDPFLFQGQAGGEQGCPICYSDVWICDEAITRQWSSALPRPSGSQLTGPGSLNGVQSYVDEETVDSLFVSVGNDTGALVISDVWILLGQSSPSIESAQDWDTNDGSKLSHDSSNPPPYALNLPADSPQGRSSRDPLLLHQARYAGQGDSEYDVSEARLKGRSAKRQPLQEKPGLRASTGLPSSRASLGGRRSVSEATGSAETGPYWKALGSQNLLPDIGRTPLESGLSARWKNLYEVLIGLGKVRGTPPARALRLLSSVFPEASTNNGSLYVYNIGLSSLSLLRREYAPSGLYVTNPLRTLEGSNGTGMPAEIHEISLVTDPPIATLGNRVRFWVIPDKNSGTSDSPAEQLARAVPLDTTAPRATFHSAVETLPGLQPAGSDIATAFGVKPPAFYITPSINTQEIDSLDPDAAAQGIRLDFIPYVNREAIYHITYAIAAGNRNNPNIYDANALRPVIDFLSTFDSGFQSSVIATQIDPTAHVEPGSINTVALPFLDQTQLPVVLKQPYTLVYGFVSKPEGLDGSTLMQLPIFIINTDNTASVNFVAPIEEGTYKFDAILTFPGPPKLIYTVHITFNVKKPYTSSDVLRAVTGYRPVTVTLKLPSGRKILPDSLGSPRPGEIIYQSGEILSEATALQLINNAANPAEYAPTSADGTTSSATQVLTTVQRSYGTANFPVAAGAQGAAIDLYWHRSTEFDPAKGGILVRFDVKIPPTDYTINVHTGQVIIAAAPPYSWDASNGGYDQVLANYFWRVGDIAPREWFPPPSIYDRQEFTGSPLDFIGTPIGVRPLTMDPTVSGTTLVPTAQLLIDTHFEHVDGPANWTAIGIISINDGESNPDGIGQVVCCSNREGVYQSTPYLGPGNYHVSFKSKNWKHGDDGRGYYFTLLVTTNPTNPDDRTSIIEQYGPTLVSQGNNGWDNNWVTFPGDAIWGASAAALAEGQLATPQVLPGSKPLYVILVLQIVDSNSNFNGHAFASASLTAEVITPIYGCTAGYTLSADSTICNLTSTDVETSTSITVSGGLAAGSVAVAPTDVASLLKGPISQSYPVTRNVTNYSSNTPATLREANMDPLSPDYYPVIEYRIDPGGLLRFGTDLSSLGIFAGTQISIQYEYLDVNPRIVLEVIPTEDNQLTAPRSSSDTSRPQVSTVEVSSLLFLINARY